MDCDGLSKIIIDTTYVVSVCISQHHLAGDAGDAVMMTMCSCLTEGSSLNKALMKPLLILLGVLVLAGRSFWISMHRS